MDMGDQQLAILFTSRPQLPFAKPMPKNKPRPLDGFINEHRDYGELFEDLAPPPRKVEQTIVGDKMKVRDDRLLNTRKDNKVAIKECKN